MDIPQIVSAQKEFFKTHGTLDSGFRKETLKRLRDELISREKEILNALHQDFRKPEFEGVMSETAIVINELDLVLRKLTSWAKPKSVAPALLTFPSRSRVYKEPYGTVLIISPWNYPFQLVLSPLIGAIAAGNTAVIKPSELSPNTSRLVSSIIRSVFDEKHVAVVEGDAAVAENLLRERWDYIFFTGSVPVGKIVATAAARHLTPVTLELGGKNPCLVDKNVNVKLAAKRIIWGKFINGGQTCIAPDYLLVHRSIREELIDAARAEIESAYGKDPRHSKDYPRIINTDKFDTLSGMISGKNVLAGGESDRNDLYIAPTLIECPGLECVCMKGEIFGPILPVITYENEQEISKIINAYEKPLAFYVFSNDRKLVKRVIREFSFGGGTINDTTVHFANHRLPFGGVGHSGTGAYHGKHSFETFSHSKGITERYNWPDIPVRYAPYDGKMRMLRFLMRWFR